MLQRMRLKKRFGCAAPRQLTIDQISGLAQEKVLVSRLSAVKAIDVFEQALPDSILHGSKRIKEIIFANENVVVVTEGGICRAYNMVSTKFVADLNPENPWRKVTTAVYHQANDTIVVVYEPTPGGLQCRVLKSTHLEMGYFSTPGYCRAFENVILSHPAFFEFDEANGMILAAQQGEVQSFQFWSHASYELVFTVHGEEFEEVRISHGLVAMFKPSSLTTFVATVFDIDDGRRLADICIPIVQYRSVEFLELVVSQLLFKQDQASLRIIDLLDNGATTKINHTRDSFAPIGFVFFETPTRVNGKKYLDESARRFFTISRDSIQFWVIHKRKLEELYRIKIQGLRDAGLCQQALTSNLLVVSPSHAPVEVDKTIKNNPYFTGIYCTQRRTSPGASCATFVTALQLHGKGGAISDEATIRSVTTIKASSGPCKNDLRKMGMKGLQCFSMRDGRYIGTIPTELCEAAVEVLQISLDRFLIGCGDHKGCVKLIHPREQLYSYGESGSACTPEGALGYTLHLPIDRMCQHQEVATPLSAEEVDVAVMPGYVYREVYRNTLNSGGVALSGGSSQFSTSSHLRQKRHSYHGLQGCTSQRTMRRKSTGTLATKASPTFSQNQDHE